MKTRTWLVLFGAVFFLLPLPKILASGACTCARSQDWRKPCPLFAGAGQANATPSCPNCSSAHAMPRWWVSEPGISLGMVDTPLFYTMSSGQEMDFTFYYNQRAGFPTLDESPITFSNAFATGKQYQHGPNCGAEAFWGCSWNMSVEIKPIQRQTDLTFAGGYYAMVFYPNGTLELYTNTPGTPAKNPLTQMILTDNSGGAGYPKVAAEDSNGDGLSTNMPTADANGFYWGDPNIGIKLLYPDGSQDIFALSGYTIGTSFPLKPATNYVSRLLLTQRIDPAGRVTKLGYEFYKDPNYEGLYRIEFVVDPDSRTNTFSYTATNNAQLAEIDDPYGRKTTLKYNGDGTLAQIVDAIGLTNSFQYSASQVIPSTYYVSDGSDVVGGVTYTTIPSSGWITQLTTPYGATHFVYYEMDDSSTTNGVQQRAVYSSGPEGAQELYCYLHKNDSLPSTADVTPYVPGVTNFDDGNAGGVSGHNRLFYRNTFHWGPRQFAALANGNNPMSIDLVSALSLQTTFPAQSQSEFSSALSALTTNDLNKAEMKHWLWCSDNITLSSSLSSERAPSFDSAGNTPGIRTWYNYFGKPDNGAEDIGGNPQIACIAKVLPDGSSQYSTYHFYPANANGAGLVSDNEFTYTKLDGSVGLLTNTFTYATNNVDLLSVSNSAGQYVNYGYNGSHQILTVTNALQQVANLSWDVNTHNMIGIQLASGQTITLGYYSSTIPPTSTSLMPQWLVIQPQGRTFTNNSYYAGLPTSVTDDRSVTTANTWDKLNRLTGTIYPDGTSISNSYYRLDLIATKDRLMNWTYFAYDGLQHLTNFTDANGVQTQYSWCSCGALNEIYDAQNSTNHPTYLNYDNQGNLYNITFPDSSSLNYQFDLAGRMTNASDGVRSLQVGHNIQGLPTTITSASGTLRSAVYDALDRPVILTDANSVTVTNTFDGINELIKRTWTDNISEGYGYSAKGLITYTNRDGKVTIYNRDNAGRLTGLINANQEITQYAYDSLDNITNLWDGNTNRTRWQYNEYGWLTNKMDGLNRTTFRWVYNANGWVTNRWTPEKGNIGYAYDNVGNLKTIVYPQQINTYAYDALNRMTNMVDAVGTTAFSYTPAGRLQSENGPWPSATITYGYAQGLRTNLSLTQPNGTWSQTYGYDSSWRLQTLTSQAGSFGYAYNFNPASALVTAITLPNGASITNGYDSLARLRVTALNNYWGHTLDSYQYVPDALGLRTNIVRILGLTTSTVIAGYDNINQLTSWTAKEANGTPRLNEQLGFGYDPAHNLHSRNNGAMSQIFTTDTANELTNVTRTGTFTMNGATPVPVISVTVNGLPAQTNGDFTFARTNIPLLNSNTTFTNIAQNMYGVKATNIMTLNLPQSVKLAFDNNGNLTNDGARTFAYDSENQLTNVMIAGSWKSDFVYDGANRRRIVRDYIWQGGAWVKTNETHLVYDGYLPIQERDANNNVLVTYTRGSDQSGSLQDAGGIGGLLARTDTNGSTFYHSEANGNITALMDVNENIVGRYLYGPFGQPLGQWGPMANVNTIQVSSMFQHIGITLYPRRSYLPEIARFSSQDPIFEAGGINLYRFVGNNPINYVDPYGLDLEDFLNNLNDFLISVPGPTGPEVAGAEKAGAKLGEDLPKAAAAVSQSALIVAHDSAAAVEEGANAAEAAVDAAKSAFDAYEKGKKAEAALKAKPKICPVSKSKYPEEHALAQKSGNPSGPFTKVDKTTRDATRADNLKGTDPVPGKDRGEWPPAMTAEGKGARVEPIDPSQNRGSGATIGNQTRDLDPGDQFIIHWVD